jgi:opacity protein-like surface antigen
MRNDRLFAACPVLLFFLAAPAHADYSQGMTMFQIYGGGSVLSGRYHQPGVSNDEQDYADGGSVIGGEFLYYISDSPCIALGFDVSHTDFDSHDSFLLLPNRFTQSTAKNTTGLVIARVVYPRGRVRPYIQGGLGAQSTSLTLDGTPINSTTWSDTPTTETRQLLDSSHVGPALEGAIGLHVYITKRLFVGAEYKVMELFEQDFSPTAAGQTEGLQKTSGIVTESSIGLMLGLGF